MKRKQFLLTSLATIPALALANIKPANTNTDKPFVVRAGKGRFGKPMKYKGVHPNDIIISRKDTNDMLSVFAYTGFAKIGPSTHLHFNQDEIFTVVEGSYRFVTGEEIMELNAGDTIFLPRNIPHTWIQLTDMGKLIYAVQPAGTLEDFFIEMDGLTKPPTKEEAERIHLKHGMKLIGPGLKL